MTTTETPNQPTNHALTRVLGPVQEAVVDGIDVYVGGTDDRIASATSVTIRQASGIPGWVGTIDTDLTDYADVKLELRRSGSSTDCAVLFTVGGGLKDRTLIRGARQHLVTFD